ncbi:MAG: Gx transporter family protein [Lachnospiraceae bacterium]|nr:Gx transporter family protein [Lachnospiraceae bacterium]
MPSSNEIDKEKKNNSPLPSELPSGSYSGTSTESSSEALTGPSSEASTGSFSGASSGAGSGAQVSARRVALTGLLAALALIFSYVEVLVPFNAGVPGIKLGLANLVPLIILYRLDARYAFAANLIRVFLAGLLFSGMFAALYSLAGSVTSFIVMYLLKNTRLFSVIGVSTAGGVFHNIGQLCVAILAISGPQLIHYLPVLIISGMIAGIIVGIGAAILLDRIPAKLFRE